MSDFMLMMMDATSCWKRLLAVNHCEQHWRNAIRLAPSIEYWCWLRQSDSKLLLGHWRTTQNAVIWNVVSVTNYRAGKRGCLRKFVSGAFARIKPMRYDLTADAWNPVCINDAYSLWTDTIDSTRYNICSENWFDSSTRKAWKGRLPLYQLVNKWDSILLPCSSSSKMLN